MKKVLLVLTISVLTLGLSANTSQGTLLLSGGFGFTSSSPTATITSGGTTVTQDFPSSSAFGLNVLGGFFVADNLAVGLGLGFDYDKTRVSGDTWTDDEILSIVSIAPTFRFYMPAGEKLSFFGSFGLGLGFGSYKEVFKEGGITLTEEFSISAISVGITPGFNYMLSSKVGLEISYGFLGFESETRTLDDANVTYKIKSPVVGLDLDLSRLRFGVNFML